MQVFDKLSFNGNIRQLLDFPFHSESDIVNNIRGDCIVADIRFHSFYHFHSLISLTPFTPLKKNHLCIQENNFRHLFTHHVISFHVMWDEENIIYFPLHIISAIFSVTSIFFLFKFKDTYFLHGKWYWIFWIQKWDKSTRRCVAGDHFLRVPGGLFIANLFPVKKSAYFRPPEHFCYKLHIISVLCCLFIHSVTLFVCLLSPLSTWCVIHEISSDLIPSSKQTTDIHLPFAFSQFSVSLFSLKRGFLNESLVKQNKKCRNLCSYCRLISPSKELLIFL